MKLSGPFLFILATLLIDAIGVGIVFPIMPDLMDRAVLDRGGAVSAERRVRVFRSA